jgi:hypothetical protein
MRSLLRATTLAVVASLALATATFATTERPMSGGFTVAVVPVDQRCGPNALTIGFEGSGIATHLGRMTGTGSNCTELSLAQGAVGIWDGIATYVGADGSSITVAYDGVQQAPVAGVALATTSSTVISGTGRFAGATGAWEGSGTIDFTTGLFTGTFSGWVSY